MKTLIESLLDNDDKLFKDTNSKTVLINKIKSLNLNTNNININDIRSIYDAEIVWFKYFEVIMGNFNEFPKAQLNIFLELLKYYFPHYKIVDPDDNYNYYSIASYMMPLRRRRKPSSIETPTGSNISKDSVKALSNSEISKIEKTIDKLIDKSEVKFNDVQNLSELIFGTKFMFFAEDAMSPSASAYWDLSYKVNNALIEIGLGDIKKWAKQARTII